MFTGFDCGRSTMNQPANWNSPPNKSPLYISASAPGDACILSPRRCNGRRCSVSFIVFAGTGLSRKANIVSVCDRRTDYSGTIVQITKHARHGETAGI
mgnify:CR=1 FL=1